MHPIISTADLADRLASPQAGAAPLRVLDVTLHLNAEPDGSWRIDSALHDFESGHIPSSAYVDLQRQLSDTTSALRFTRLPDAALADAFSAAGLSDGDDVVLYSRTNPMWASRVWWMLRALGHDARVLDGGWGKWQAEQRPLAQGPASLPPGRLSARPRPGHWADRDDVLRAVGDGAVCTLNALTASLHSGERKAGYARAGHIRGSVNVPYPDLTQPDGTLRPLHDLRARFAAVGSLQRPRVICYCGGGIAATLTAMALTMLGHRDVAVYDGSLSEWAADPSLPMDTSTPPGA